MRFWRLINGILCYSSSYGSFPSHSTATDLWSMSIYLDVADSAGLPSRWSRYASFILAVVSQIGADMLLSSWISDVSGMEHQSTPPDYQVVGAESARFAYGMSVIALD